MATKMVIVMRKDLNMRKGKMVAQGGHAVLGIFTDLFIHWRGDAPRWPEDAGKVVYALFVTKEMEDWLENSFTKVCVSCDSEAELLALYSKAVEAKLPAKLITDSGRTEFNGVPTNTCIAIGPAKEEEIDIITGHLPLL